jgi:uncharacterized iron-regulated membrane protein
VGKADGDAREAAVSVPTQRGKRGRSDKPERAKKAEEVEEGATSRRRRRSLHGVLAVAAAVVLLGLAGLVTTLQSEPEPEPAAAAPVPAATARPVPSSAATPASASTALDAPLRAAVDPQSRPAAAYLGALRQAQVPTSRTGLAETEAAEVICRQLADGTDQTAMVRALPSVLTTVTSAQAPIVVKAAQDNYCRA